MSLKGNIPADGELFSYTVKRGPVKLSFNGTFGSGTIALTQKMRTGTAALLDNGTAITITAADDSEYRLYPGDTVIATLSGSSSPSIDWSISE